MSLQHQTLSTLNGCRVFVPKLIPKSILWFYRLKQLKKIDVTNQSQKQNLSIIVAIVKFYIKSHRPPLLPDSCLLAAQSPACNLVSYQYFPYFKKSLRTKNYQNFPLTDVGRKWRLSFHNFKSEKSSLREKKMFFISGFCKFIQFFNEIQNVY